MYGRNTQEIFLSVGVVYQDSDVQLDEVLAGAGLEGILVWRWLDKDTSYFRCLGAVDVL